MTMTNIQVFPGLIFMMALIKLPNIEDYWKKDEVLNQLDFRKKVETDIYLFLLTILQIRKNTGAHDSAQCLMSFILLKTILRKDFVLKLVQQL